MVTDSAGLPRAREIQILAIAEKNYKMEGLLKEWD